MCARVPPGRVMPMTGTPHQTLSVGCRAQAEAGSRAHRSQSQN